MWFHIATMRLHLPNADSIAEKLHSKDFGKLVKEYGGLQSYVLECPDHPTEFTFLTAWEEKEDAETFLSSKVYTDFIDEIEPLLVSPVCERRFEVMSEREKV